jgi:hypothetical protein
MPKITIDMQKLNNALARINSVPHLIPPITFVHNMRQTESMQNGNRYRRISMSKNTLNQLDQGLANQDVCHCLELLQLALRISLHKWNEKDAAHKFKENYQYLLNNILQSFNDHVINKPIGLSPLLKKREVKFINTNNKRNSHLDAVFLKKLHEKLQNFITFINYADIKTAADFHQKIDQLTEPLYVFCFTLLLNFSDSSAKITFEKILGADFTRMLGIQDDLNSLQETMAPYPANTPVSDAIGTADPITVFNKFLLNPPILQNSNLQIYS